MLPAQDLLDEEMNESSKELYCHSTIITKAYNFKLMKIYVILINISQKRNAKS
jgi:hypothetical protein